MENIEVKIVQLEPMRVATAHGFGEGPEGIAWDKMTAWLKQRGMWQDGSSRRYFGFGNPSPSAASPNYGYKVWASVGPEVEPEGEVTIKDFSGGLYAVTRCVVKNPWEDIPAT
jgi:DNA gyrase inhibitor GyrI